MVENIELSTNFIQEFFENHKLANPQPILQILKSTPFEKNNICARLRLSDGTFFSTLCALSSSVAAQIQKDELNETDKCPIIKVLKYVSNNANGTITMAIKNYEVLDKDSELIGNPAAHPSDPEFVRDVGALKRKSTETNSSDTSNTTPKKVAKTVGDGGVVLPLSAISPLMTGKWRICGVITGKEDLRQINSKKGPMKVFSFILSDKTGESIKLTAFAETAEKFFGQIEKNKCYYISGKQSCIKPANKAWNSTGHDYEINLNNESQIEKSNDQHYEVRTFVLNKISLDQLSTYSGQTVDILAVVDKVEEPTKVNTKYSPRTSRRYIHLIDESAIHATLTIWGDQAINFALEVGQIMGIKGAYVREFNGTYSLSINASARIEIDPVGKETEALSKWYENERPNLEVKSISNNGTSKEGKFLEEARVFAAYSNPSVFHDQERGIYFSSVAYITSIRTENAIYKSCPDCSKKVTERSNGLYRCEKCHKSLKDFKYCYMISMEITDVCGPTWVTMFDDKAEIFFGKSATEMGELQTTENDEYEAILNSKILGCYNFRCRAKYEMFNDVYRTKINVVDFRKPDFVQYDQALDELMERLETI